MKYLEYAERNKDWHTAKKIQVVIEKELGIPTEKCTGSTLGNSDN